MGKYILIKKMKKTKDKEKEFASYALRLENEEKWISATVLETAQARLIVDKVEFPILIELDAPNDYFIGRYQVTNKVTGEVTSVPKVVIKDYRSIKHVDLPVKTIEEVLQDMH